MDPVFWEKKSRFCKRNQQGKYGIEDASGAEFIYFQVFFYTKNQGAESLLWRQM